jgi:hypothetical protein
METMRAILKAACVVGLVSLAVAPGARAGEYHVYACRTPSGESAPPDGLPAFLYLQPCPQTESVDVGFPSPPYCSSYSQ